MGHSKSYSPLNSRGDIAVELSGVLLLLGVFALLWLSFDPGSPKVFRRSLQIQELIP